MSCAVFDVGGVSPRARVRRALLSLARGGDLGAEGVQRGL